MDYERYFWQGQMTRLRPVSVEDAEARWIDRLDSPARQMLQLGVELPATTGQLSEKLAAYADCRDVNGLILFAIETLEGELVGGLSYHTRDPKNGTFSFGVTIDTPHRRQGYAADATRILLRYGFLERRYHKCNSACVAGNLGSIKLHLTLGFREEGRRVETIYYNGRYQDELLFGMTFEQFEALDAPLRPDWFK